VSRRWFRRDAVSFFKSHHPKIRTPPIYLTPTLSILSSLAALAPPSLTLHWGFQFILSGDTGGSLRYRPRLRPYFTTLFSPSSDLPHFVESFSFASMEGELPGGGVGDSGPLSTHGRPNAGEGGSAILQKAAAIVVADLQSTAAPALEVKV
jgi:hypothetical protein